MRIIVTADDVFFTCAHLLHLPLDSIIGVEFDTEEVSGVKTDILIIDLKEDASPKILRCPPGVPVIKCVYNFLTKEGLWGWQYPTRH